jgi:hypothetical protein
VKKLTLAAAFAGLALSLAACGGVKTLTDQQHKDAKFAAMEFTNSLHGQFVSCMTTDTDKNKSVTCTSRIPTPTALGGRKLELTELECGYVPGASCKLKALKR